MMSISNPPTYRAAAPFVTILAMAGIACLTAISQCPSDLDGDGWSTADGDCDDTNATVHPGAEELCDELDNDCDTEIDEGTLGKASNCAALNCLEIRQSAADLSDGLYWIDPDGDGDIPALEAYCDMTTDGGGWLLVASNYSGDLAFPTGTNRTGLYLDIEGYNGRQSVYADYLIGPAMKAVTFSEGRLLFDRYDDGTVVADFTWPTSCYECYNSDNFSQARYLEDHNVSTLGCGHAFHCNLDGQYADTYDGAWNSNSNQRTIGGVCTQTNPDPSSGTYVGHGANEAAVAGEGNYYEGPSGCTYYDFSISATWVR